jgi:nucleoside-diphosphate-sugar epimerase
LVGSHLLLELALQGKKVKALKRDTTDLSQAKEVFHLYSNKGDSLFNTIEWVVCDLLDLPALDHAFKNVSMVYHCAAKISFDPKEDLALTKNNIVGTANIVNLCISYVVEKLVHVSSIAALGENNHMITEATHWNPEKENSMYAITKYGAELEVWRGTQEGLNAIIVNPGVILGDVFFSTGSGKIFSKIKKGFDFYTGGKIGFVGVKDVVTCMITLMNSTISNEQFILVSENWSYQKLFSTIAKELNPSMKLKKTTKTQLKFALFLDLIKHYVFRSKRSLFNTTVKTANKSLSYDASKIKKSYWF